LDLERGEFCCFAGQQFGSRDAFPDRLDELITSAASTIGLVVGVVFLVIVLVMGLGWVEDLEGDDLGG